MRIMRTVLLPFVAAGAAVALVALAAAPAAHAQARTVDDTDAPPVAPADVAFDDTLPTEIAGEIAIDLKDDATDADIQAFAGRYGLSVRPNSAWSTSDRLEVADVDPLQE